MNNVQNLYPVKDANLQNFAEMIPANIWKHGGLVEIVVPDYQAIELELLLPALSQRSHHGRWLAWLSPAYRLSTDKLKQYSINPSRLLRIYPSQQGPHIRLLSRALANGRYSSIIAWSTQCDDTETKQIKNAAKRGNSLGILIINESNYIQQQSSADVQLRIKSDETGKTVIIATPEFSTTTVYQCSNNEPADTTNAIIDLNDDEITSEIPAQLTFF